MPRHLAVLASLSLVMIAAHASSADARTHRRAGHHDVVRERARPKALVHSARSRAPVVVYLNRDGGVIGGGDDDAQRDRSWLVPGKSATVPAWSGGDARWGKVMACVRDRFSAFDVQVTDQRPTAPGYIMAMVGGSPSLLGMTNDVSGIAPWNGEVERNTVVFVFAENVENDAETTCVDVLHEVGHAMGLDHEYLCQDPMSYLWNCEEPKTFQDQDAPCGEDEPRACEGGGTQNSWRMLAKNVGLRGGDDLPWPTGGASSGGAVGDDGVDAGGDGGDDGDDGDDGVDAGGDDGDDGVDAGGDAGGAGDDGDDGVDASAADGRDDGGDDGADAAADDDADCGDDDGTAGASRGGYGHDGPGRGHHHHGGAGADANASASALALDVRGPRGTIAGNQTITITVRAPTATEATLGWVAPDGQYALTCGQIPRGSPARCARRGDTFTFQLDVGVGRRYFAVRVADAAGRERISDFTQLYLRDD